MRSNRVRGRYKAKKRMLTQINKLTLKYIVGPSSAFLNHLFKRYPSAPGGKIIEETIHYKESWNGETK